MLSHWVQSLPYLVRSLSSWFLSLRKKVLKPLLSRGCFKSISELEDVFIGCFHLLAGFDKIWSVWFCLLPLFTFLFICRGGCGGKPQCFILLTEFWQLSCFITLHKLFLRDKLFSKSLILARTTAISIVHFCFYSIISFFIVSLT